MIVLLSQGCRTGVIEEKGGALASSKIFYYVVDRPKSGVMWVVRAVGRDYSCLLLA